MQMQQQQQAAAQQQQQMQMQQQLAAAQQQQMQLQQQQADADDRFAADKPASSYASNSSVQSWIAEENEAEEAAPLLRSSKAKPIGRRSAASSLKKPSLSRAIRTQSRRAQKRVIILDESTPEEESAGEIAHIVLKAWVPLTAVFLVFVVCIGLFPGKLKI